MIKTVFSLIFSHNFLLVHFSQFVGFGISVKFCVFHFLLPMLTYFEEKKVKV